MTHTFDTSIVSDLHKDAFGFRPREYFWDCWEEMTDDEKQSEWDSLCAESERQGELDRAHEAADVVAFEALVEAHIELGAKDRTTALRWMTQTEEFYNIQCVEQWVWEKGILFTDTGRALVKELMEIVEIKDWEAA